MLRAIIFLAAAVGLVGAGIALAQQRAPGDRRSTENIGVSRPETYAEKVSYSIGFNIGRDFRSQELNVDLKLVAHGIADGLRDGRPLLSEQEIQTVTRQLQKQLQDRYEARRKILAEKNLQQGQTFLSRNRSRDNVVTLPSGLQYEVLRRGSGPRPTASDVVKVHYHGTLIDGTIFDSSVKRGEAIQFPVNQVISGWTEALQRMQVGEKWRLFLPPDLAYGEEGTPSVGPNAVVVFDLELLGIEKEELSP